MIRPIRVVATLICGTLDILFAMILTVSRGTNRQTCFDPLLRGPFPARDRLGTGGSMLGLPSHFTLMAIMVAVFVLASRSGPRCLTGLG